MEAGAIGLPVQFQPELLLQGAEPQLQPLGLGLLGLFKPGRQQQGAEFCDHGPEAGGVLGLHHPMLPWAMLAGLSLPPADADGPCFPQAHGAHWPQWGG